MSLIKCAANRMTKELMNGRLSDEAVNEIQRLNIGGQVGNHNNLAVLGKESNDIKRLGLYGAPTSNIENLRRTHTHEPELMKRITGKEYGKEVFTHRDLKKLRNAPHDFDVPDIITFRPKTRHLQVGVRPLAVVETQCTVGVGLKWHRHSFLHSNYDSREHF